MHSSAEIAQKMVTSAQAKVALTWWQQALLGVLAGAFIAFGAQASNMVAFNLLADSETYGLGRMLAGAIFPVGLMLVTIAGGELFTGNVLIGAVALKKKVKIKALLKNWFLVYLGNLLGALLVSFLIAYSGLLSSGDGLLGAMTVKIASSKVQLDFISAFCLGILCNWLICLAVWMALGTNEMQGKLLAIFFPVWLCIASGFEHCIANMYYIPAGILASKNEVYISLAALQNDFLMQLNWTNFFLDNLLPVTLGNILGGLLFVGIAYSNIYQLKK